MNDYNYTEEQRREVTECIAKTEEWFKMKDEIQWNLQEDAKKEGIMIYYVTSKRGHNLLKATGVVDFPNWVILQVMTNGKYRSSYDINVDMSECIEKAAANTYHIYQRSKKMGVWPVSIEPRDFVMTSHMKVHEDGTISLIVYTDPSK